jgi:hypothetical protein
MTWKGAQTAGIDSIEELGDQVQTPALEKGGNRTRET